MHDRCSSKGVYSATVGDANDIDAMRQRLKQISYALAQSRSLAPAAYNYAPWCRYRQAYCSPLADLAGLMTSPVLLYERHKVLGLIRAELQLLYVQTMAQELR